jgi:hypothetical protein
MIICCLLRAAVLTAQTPVRTVIYDYSAASTGLTYTIGSSVYKYGNLSGTSNNVQNVTGFTLPSGTYYYNVFIDGAVKIRRVNNPIATGRRTLVWMESVESSGNYNIYPPYTDSMELFFDGRTINKGTDNLFGNQGDGSGNNNNIERVDWVVPDGLTTTNPTESGFAIFERGADNAHDPFCIAPVLALDANGDPAQYGNILRVTSAHYGNIPNSSLNYSILRKEQNDTWLARSTNGNQNRGGVFISFQDLGIGAGQTIYGYSLFAYDLPTSATPANLKNYTNTTYFPTNTSSNTSQGGIDLIAITGLFNTSTTSVTLPVQYDGWTATLNRGEALLRWRVAAGIPCTAIEVEKSGDGESWTTTVRLPSSATRYAEPLPGAGRFFYRLKLFSGDGFTYTSIQQLYQTPQSASAPILQQHGNTLRLSYTSSANANASVTLYTETGQILSTHSFRSVKGPNNFSMPQPISQRKILVRIQLGEAIFTRLITTKSP